MDGGLDEWWFRRVVVWMGGGLRYVRMSGSRVAPSFTRFSMEDATR